MKFCRTLKFLKEVYVDSLSSSRAVPELVVYLMFLSQYYKEDQWLETCESSSELENLILYTLSCVYGFGKGVPFIVYDKERHLKFI